MVKGNGEERGRKREKETGKEGFLVIFNIHSNKPALACH
jgi:hypothetical protein